MEYGVISDIHGNKKAFQAVYMSLMGDHDVDEIIFCGDAVGILGWSLHTVYMVDGVCDHIVFGNHDARVREDFGYAPSFPAAYDEHAIVTEDLTEDAIGVIESWPERIETDDFIVAHSWPKKTQKEDQSVHGFQQHDYGVTPKRVTKAGKYANGKYVFLGHTHEQFEQSLDKFEGLSGRVVNPGSVGVPWHGTAQYAVVNTGDDTVSLESVEFDNDAVEEKLNEWDEKIGLRTWK